jgi:signal transduction histidine kinase/ligand-binding sensor domain-containing protein
MPLAWDRPINHSKASSPRLRAILALACKRPPFSPFKFRPAIAVRGLWVAGVMLMLMGNGGIAAAEKIHREAPAHAVDGSFVREWLVLGPFPSKDLEFDFLGEAGGEASVSPKEGDTVTRSDGTQLRWTRLRSSDGIVNLEKILGIQPWSVAYAYCELSADQPMETDLRLPMAPSVVWINGQKVELTSQILSGPGNVPPARPVHLNAGANPFLLKLKVETGEWTFSAQPLPPERASIEVLVTDFQGRPVPEAVIRLYDQGEPVWHLRTGGSGQAEACLYPPAKAYDLRVTSGETGVWLYGVALQPGERRRLTLLLTNAVSISGRVLAMDGSAQNAIVVQALREPDVGSADPPVRPDVQAGQQRSPAFNGGIQSLLPLPPFSETVLSDINGYFQFVNLRPGAYRLRCHGSDGFIHPANHSNPMASAPVIVAPGRTNEPFQFVFAEARKGVWRNYSITKGLVELSPMSIHRTPDGLLWVGTDGGTLHSYDGLEFKMFQAPQIPGSHVQSIKHEFGGAVWIGTSGGISRGVAGKFEPLPTGNRPPRDYVRDIVADSDGSVWFGTTGGLCKYDGGKLSTWTVADGLPSNNTGSLLRARDGALWIGTGSALATFKNETFSVPLSFPEFSALEATRLHQAQDGAIWFCSSSADSGGAYRFDGASLWRLGTEEGLPSERVFGLAETSNGDLWFATANGLSRFNGVTVVNYTVRDGLSNDWVRDIFVDEDDVLWLANGWGVSRFDPEGFLRVGKQDGLQDGEGDTPSVFAIEPDQERGFWVGTQWGGLYRINGEGRHRDVTSVFREPGYLRQIHRAANGALWFAASSGIFKQENGVLTQVLHRNWVVALTSDDQGRIWYGQGWNGGGVSRFDPATGVETVFTRKHGLIDDSVWALKSIPRGGVLIGTGAGLMRAEGETIENEGARLGLPAAVVHDLRHDATGTLWISKHRGLHSWDGKTALSISTTNGLPEGQVWCSVRAPDGVVWIGTESNGLIGYDGKAMSVLDKRDGLQGNNVFSLAMEGPDSLWIGFLDGGLTRYRRSKSRPSVQVNEMTLGDRTLTNTATRSRTETGHRIVIRYREIDLKTHPEKRQFWYRLANQAGQTVFAGVTRYRSFEWVPDKKGNYTFEVQAIDRDLNYSEPARVLMQVVVPWHANAWILAPGTATFGGLLIWAFVALGLYRRKSREAALLRERVRISRDLHDHLGAGLTHLSMVGDMVRQQAHQPDAVQMLATRLTDSARQLTRTMGEIIWTTDPEKDTLPSFVSFICSYAERFFAGSHLRLRFDLPSEVPDLMLPAQHRSHLLTVTKEALNNVAKHAEACELRIKLEVAGHELHLSFEDNGRGFLMNQVAPDCHGLANMQERVRGLGGELRFESAAGQGTQMRVRVPLPNA